MKKLLALIFAICVISTNVVLADNAKIIPQELTKKETEYFTTVNDAADRAFTKIKKRVKTSKFAPDYDNTQLFADDYHVNNNYFYVEKPKNIVLVYDKITKKLEYISIKKSDIPYACAFYAYPSGELKYVKVWNNKTEWFMFNANGKYIDYEPYVKSVRLKIAENLKLPSRKIFTQKNGKLDITPVTVSISIDNQGKVLDFELVEKSNMEEINKSITTAINASSPFKVFPEEFINKYVTVMFKFNF